MEQEFYYKIFPDGMKWCCVTNKFKNLVDSLATFGNTPLEAMQKMMDEERVFYDQELARREEELEHSKNLYQG